MGSPVQADFAPLTLKAPELDVWRDADGAIHIASRLESLPAAATLPDLLEQAVADAPDAPFLSEGGADGWTTISYGEFHRRACAFASRLLETPQGRSGKPMAILSGNSIHHLIAQFGAQMIGKPVAPLSPAYALMSSDFGRLKTVVDICAPDLFYVEDATPFTAALQALGVEDAAVLSLRNGAGPLITEWTSGAPSPRLSEARAAVTADHLAKLMFTSGSTGTPKCSIQTHAMLCAQIAGMEALELSDTRGDGTVLLDWLPWSHVAGGNIGINRVLHRRAHLHIDSGRPFPGMFDATVRALKDVRPTEFLGTPVGFQMLADALEQDDGLRIAFFSRLRRMASGGAALAGHVYERIQNAAIATTGAKIPFTTVYGATEVQSVAMVHWQTDKTHLVGAPTPGVEMRLKPFGKAYALAVRGATVSPGYLQADGQVHDERDKGGFFELGDLVWFEDPDHPEKGLSFAGRTVENFKLNTGTWVDVGAVRRAALEAAGGLLSDCVVCGVNENQVGLLAWPSPGAKLEDSATLEVRLDAYNRTAGGSSNRIGRLLLLDTRPNFDTQEITDKGYINQQRVRETRAEEVKRLFSTPLAEGVIDLSPAARS